MLSYTTGISYTMLDLCEEFELFKLMDVRYVKLLNSHVIKFLSNRKNESNGNGKRPNQNAVS